MQRPHALRPTCPSCFMTRLGTCNACGRDALRAGLGMVAGYFVAGWAVYLLLLRLF
jgi:hypothetical protein